LAEQWQAPVAVTPKAKGHFPESHPLFAGCFSAYGDSPLREALTKADVILGVGLDSVDFVTSTWDIDTPMVNLNQSSDDDPAFDPVVTVNGDIQASLSYLAAHVDRAVSAPAMVTQKVSDLKQQIDQCMVFDGFTPREGSILVGHLINGLREALPDDGAVTIDVGVFKLVFLQQWHTDSPKSLFVANGLSAMGYAVPGALAVALEQPARKVAAVVGDGALLMYAGELATAARYRGSLIIIVIVDKALSLIRLKQLRLDIPIHGTEFKGVDYSALAESFDLEYRLIDGTRPSGAVFAEALTMNSPVLVEARVDRDEYDQFR
jgi:acetolactate synthase-1/2/3 large subunit